MCVCVCVRACACVHACVCACQGINSNHAQTARFNIPTSYHYCKPSVLCVSVCVCVCVCVKSLKLKPSKAVEHAIGDWSHARADTGHIVNDVGGITGWASTLDPLDVGVVANKHCP